MSTALEKSHPTHDEADGGQLTIRSRSGRKKADGGGIRTWFHLTDTGEAGLMDVGRYAIRQLTGISARDYRILDPMLAYPPSILGRRVAVVVNLEHIKAIITAKDLWLLNHKDPAVTPFIERLKQRITNANSEDITAIDPTATDTNPGELREHHQERQSTSGSRRRVVPIIDPLLEIVEEEIDPGTEAISNNKQWAPPPFDFVVLEACLENICTSLDLEVKTLEQQAYPTLDELRSKVRDFTLDCVRHIKGRLLFLSRRVQKMKDEAERLLGNDEHMSEMCLTGKLQLREQRDWHDGAMYHKHCHVMELERLLDTYLLLFEANLNNLSMLKEQIHDMESYVNLILDDKQNSRLNLIIMNKTAHLVLNIYNGFTAVMAMTIKIPLYRVSANTSFIWINSAWMLSQSSPTSSWFGYSSTNVGWFRKS